MSAKHETTLAQSRKTHSKTIKQTAKQTINKTNDPPTKVWTINNLQQQIHHKNRQQKTKQTTNNKKKHKKQPQTHQEKKTNEYTTIAGKRKKNKNSRRGSPGLPCPAAPRLWPCDARGASWWAPWSASGAVTAKRFGRIFFLKRGFCLRFD